MISFFLQTWFPVVMQSAPAASISSARLGVMPRPPARFSPLMILKSALTPLRYRIAPSRPGFPMTSPMKTTVRTSLGIIYGSRLPDDNDLDLPRVGELCLYLLRDVL